MSRGTKLQEMEQSKTAVNANAPAPEAMPKLTTGGTSPSYEDLGGPTPENASPTNDSAKIREPKIKTVADVVTKNATKGDSGIPSGNATPGTLKQGDELEVEDSQEVVAEDQVEETVDETVSIDDDVNALLGGEELSEEFKEKAKVIFEAALNSKVKEIQETLEVQYEAKLEEEKGELKVALQDRVDSYLEYVA